MMGIRKFMEMVFTGRPFTAKEMYDCDFVNAVVPFTELEDMTEKYALACARSRPMGTVFVQKTFFEVFKQFQGEYMGSILAGLPEATGPALNPMPSPSDLTRRRHSRTDQLGSKQRYAIPIHWRLSHRGRAQP